MPDNTELNPLEAANKRRLTFEQMLGSASHPHEYLSALGMAMVDQQSPELIQKRMAKLQIALGIRIGQSADPGYTAISSLATQLTESMSEITIPKPKEVKSPIPTQTTPLTETIEPSKPNTRTPRSRL